MGELDVKEPNQVCHRDSEAPELMQSPLLHLEQRPDPGRLRRPILIVHFLIVEWYTPAPG